MAIFLRHSHLDNWIACRWDTVGKCAPPRQQPQGCDTARRKARKRPRKRTAVSEQYTPSDVHGQEKSVGTTSGVQVWSCSERGKAYELSLTGNSRELQLQVRFLFERGAFVARKLVFSWASEMLLLSHRRVQRKLIVCPVFNRRMHKREWKYWQTTENMLYYSSKENLGTTEYNI